MEILKTLGLLLVLGAVGSGVVLFLVGGGDGRWEAERMLKLGASPDRVFELLTEPSERERWVVGLRRSTCESTRVAEGSVLKETRLVDGREIEVVLEVTSYVPGQHFAYRAEIDGVPIEMSYRLAAHLSGQRCRVDYACSAQFSGTWAKLIEPLLGASLLSRIEDDHEHLQVVARGS